MLVKEHSLVTPQFGSEYEAKILRKVVENYERTRVELVSALEKVLEHNKLSSREFCQKGQKGKRLCITKPYRLTNERKLNIPPLPNGEWVDKEAVFYFRTDCNKYILIRIPIEGDITSSPSPRTQTVYAVQSYQNGILQCQQLESLSNFNVYGDAGVYLMAKTAVKKAECDYSKEDSTDEEKIEPARPFLTFLGMISCAFRYIYED